MNNVPFSEGDDRPAECISCGGCFNTDEQGKMQIYCQQLKKAAEKTKYIDP